MDHQRLQKLPLISFGKETLQRGTKSWSLARNHVRRALEECGCFLAVYDKVSFKLRDSMFSALEQLFNLPTEIRIKNTYDDTPSFGYYRLQHDFSVHESLGIGDATTLEAINNFSKLMWPHGNDHDHNFSGMIHEYTNLLSELEQVVTRMVFESYGVDKHCDSHVDSITYLLRFNSYRAAAELLEETTVSVQPHTDKTLFTILAENQVNGLEVGLEDEQWIPVDFLPSSFVVMAGDGLMAWSNNRVQPCFHRVIMNANVTRHSLGMFSYHKGIVQTPQELIDEENPQCFKPFDHLGYLSFFAQQKKMGRQSQCTIKTYCGL